jgi:hypothetical protein
MDISNNQRNLFAVIDRSYLLDGDQGKPHEDGVMIMNYTDKIELNSHANFPHQTYSQLDGNLNIGTFGKQNSQPSKIPNIDCSTRKNETASRFNYSFDYAINNRMIDVSGQHIPNENLRVIPNRGMVLCNQDIIIPENKEIAKLSQRLVNISRIDNAFKLSPNDLRYKIKNQKLTREELIGISKTGRTYQSNTQSNMLPSQDFIQSNPTQEFNQRPERKSISSSAPSRLVPYLGGDFSGGTPKSLASQLTRPRTFSLDDFLIEQSLGGPAKAKRGRPPKKK